MALKISNWGKPSNIKWKRWGDIALVLIPVYTPILATLQPISPEFSLWTIAILNIISSTFKVITKFTAEEVVEEPVETTTDATKA